MRGLGEYSRQPRKAGHTLVWVRATMNKSSIVRNHNPPCGGNASVYLGLPCLEPTKVLVHVGVQNPQNSKRANSKGRVSQVSSPVNTKAHNTVESNQPHHLCPLLCRRTRHRQQVFTLPATAALGKTGEGGMSTPSTTYDSVPV